MCPAGYRATSAFASRVSQAAANLAAHKERSTAQLASLEGELARCKLTQRQHGDQALQLGAQAELLIRQIGSAEDQKARAAPTMSAASIASPPTASRRRPASLRTATRQTRSP